jgi:diguanylate cyclase
MADQIGTHEQENMDRLCELIMDELKVLSAKRQALTFSSLHKALSAKAERFEVPGLQNELGEIKEALERILIEFNSDHDCQFGGQSSEILKQIQESESFGALYLLRDEIANLVHAYRTAIRDENRELSSLVVEISNQLADVEKKCLDLIKKATLSNQAGSTFENMVETEIDEFRRSAESCQSLPEIKKMVKVRLENIRSALEAKKVEDQIRQQHFGTEVENLRTNLEVMQTKIARDRAKRKSLEQEILVDPLTGIANRRAIERHLSKAIRKYQRHKKVFAMIFIDIDDFKRVNDTYGHLLGDKCLKKLVNKIKPIIRESDFMARYGGDEFIIVLPGADRRAAQSVARKLSDKISRTRFLYHNSEIELSVSIGLTQVEESDYSPQSIFTRADAALYEAKNQGKNRVIAV